CVERLLCSTALHKKSEIPPTAVGGYFQILSTKCLLVATLKSHQRQLVDGSDLSGRRLHVRKSELFQRFLILRRDLNNPPTAVGGIQRSHSVQLLIERI